MEEPPISELYSAFGYAATQWSFIEHAITSLCVVIHNDCNGKALIETTLPKFIKEQSRYVRKALNTLPDLAEFKTKGINVLDRIANQKDLRDDMHHSALIRSGATHGVFSLCQIEPRGDILVSRDWTFNVRSFPKTAERLGALVADSQALTTAVLAKFP